jgi:hypothetical protein
MSYIVSHHINAGQNHNIRIPLKNLEKVAEFRYLEMTETISFS